MRSVTRRVRTCTSCRSRARRCCARSRRRSRRSGVELLRPSELSEVDGGLPMHGGTEVVPLLRDGILEADRLVDIRGVVPRGVDGNVIGAGTTLSELEADSSIPAALREACRLAASPPLPNMSSVGGDPPPSHPPPHLPL